MSRPVPEPARPPLRQARGQERVPLPDLDDIMGPIEEAEEERSELPPPPPSRPRPRGRQPTIWERLAIKNYGDQDPGKAAAYMEKRGIDPDFDQGFTWHDPTVDILGDIATGVAGSVGGIAGAGVAGLPGAAGGAALGAAGARTGIKALANLARSELEPSWASVGREGLLEGALTPLMGAGAHSGLISKGLHSATRPVKWFFDRAAGINPDVQKQLARMTGREGRDETLKELAAMPAISKTPGVGMRPLSDLSRPLMENAWLASRDAVGKADKAINTVLGKARAIKPSEAGIGPKWFQNLKMGEGGEQKLQRLFQELGDAPEIKGLKLFEKGAQTNDPISARGMRRIHDYLGRNRDWIGPDADKARKSIFAALNKRTRGKLEEPWKNYGRATQDVKWLRSQNKGEDILLHSDVKGVRPRPNMGPEAKHAFFKDFADAPLEATPRIKGLHDILKRHRGEDEATKRVGGLAQKINAYELGRKKPGRVRLGDLMTEGKSRAAINNMVEALGTPISNWYNAVLHGPDVMQAGGMADWIRRGGRTPWWKHAAWEGAREIPFKGPAREAGMLALEPES